MRNRERRLLDGLSQQLSIVHASISKATEYMANNHLSCAEIDGILKLPNVQEIHDHRNYYFDLMCKIDTAADLPL